MLTKMTLMTRMVTIITGSLRHCVCSRRCSWKTSRWTAGPRPQQRWTANFYNLRSGEPKSHIDFELSSCKPGKGGRRAECWTHSWVIWEHSQKQPSALGYGWLSWAVWKAERVFVTNFLNSRSTELSSPDDNSNSNDDNENDNNNNSYLDNGDYLSTLSSLMALSFCPAEVLLKKKKVENSKVETKTLFLGAPLVLFRLLGELHAKKVCLLVFFFIALKNICFLFFSFTVLQRFCFEEKQAHKLIL